MAGVDAARGFNYQHCHEVLSALAVLADSSIAGIRVEGDDDVIDIEVHAFGKADGETRVVRGIQVKSRMRPYVWAKGDLIRVFRRWAALPLSATAEFTFQTDGELGPSGREFARALEDAARGEYGPIAGLLDVDSSDPLCAVAGQARVVAEPGSVEALLLSAEREVQSMLDGGPDHPDAAADARARVDQLWRLVSTRAGHLDPAERFIPRDEIRDAVGGLSSVPSENRWAGGLPQEYMDSACLENVKGMAVPSLSVPRRDQPLGIDDLTGLDGPLILAGRTGSGKTTIARLWRVRAASEGRVVVVCNSEGYLAGGLDRVIADAVGDVVGRDLPRVVGRQVLSDPDVTIVIDGVSEVPAEARVELSREVRQHVAGLRHARLVLQGRDEGICASLLSPTVTAQRLYPRGFDHAQRLKLTKRILAKLGEADGGLGSAVNDRSDGESEAARTESPFEHQCLVTLAQVEDALGDAAGSPMLLELAVELVASGVRFTDRASIYALTVGRLGARANAGDVTVASAVLGIMFGRLLDQGKRYANHLEWARLFQEAVVNLQDLGVASDADAVRDAVDRSGLVNEVVTDIGRKSLRIPVHDSFADYFAAFAHAEGLISLPNQLVENDENRILLSSQLRMLTDDDSLKVAKQLPFCVVRLSDADHRSLDSRAPEFVAEVLRRVLPDLTPVKVVMWRTADGRPHAQVGARDTGWVERAQAPSMFDGLTVVGEPDDGPVLIAAKLWRRVLLQRLGRSASRLRPKSPQSQREGCDQLTAHFDEVGRVGAALLGKVASDAVADRLARTVGPLGASGVVLPRENRGMRSEVWPVRYRPTPTVEWIATPGTLPTTGTGREQHTITSAVESIVSTTPEATAVRLITEGINKIVGHHWL